MSNKRDIIREESPPLPADLGDWTRYIKSERSLNDQVEDLHRLLIPTSPKYRALLRATWDSHAVEGSLAHDNAFAALEIREKAKEMGYDEVAAEKTAVISLSLGVVLRRYHASRKQRRNTVGGEEVPIEGNSE